jgi:dephospho-CoA kinase
LTANSTPAFEVWGLTGGIASGKSTAARIFAEEGFPVLDADQLARQLSLPGGAAHASILARFGTADRVQLREIVFADVAARKDLEAILHPLIQNESLQQMQTLAAQAPHGRKARVIYEAALLVETGRYRQCTGLLVVDAPRELRRRRLIERDGLIPELADQILNAQISDDERRKVASFIIPTEGTIEELRALIKRWISTHFS